MHRFSIPLITVAIALLPVTSRSADSPKDIATAYVTAMSSTNWQAMSDLMHPEALDVFHALMVRAASSKGGMQMLRDVFHISSKKEMEDLSDSKTFSQFWKGLSEDQPDVASLFVKSHVTVIGYVTEGDELAHVVIRTSLESSPGSNLTLVDVMSLKKDGEKWRLMLSTDMELLAQKLASL